jgi:hypothetical protein
MVMISCFIAASVELILKIYLAKLLEIKQKNFHKTIFEKLLNTSLDYLYGTNIGGVLNWFSLSFNKREILFDGSKCKYPDNFLHRL